MDEEDQDTKFCNNCKRQISALNFVIHEMHCGRHIVLCDKCKEPVNRSEIKQHIQDNHAKINCDKCGMTMEKDQLNEHEKNVCLKKQQRCIYCELDVMRDELDNHIDFCGSRTEQCLKCKQYIMLKDQVQHEISKCTYPAPKPSNVSARNTNVDHFTFEELSRMLQPMAKAHPVGRVDTNPTSFLPKERNVRVLETNVDRTPNHRMNKLPNSVNTAIGNTKKTFGSKRTIDGNDRRKFDYKQREIGTRPANRFGATGPRVAAQPTQDFQTKDDLDDLIQELERPFKPSISQVVRTNNFNAHGSSFDQAHVDEMSMIPCEFCGNPFPAEELFRHQSSCTDDPFSPSAPQLREEPTNRKADIEQTSVPVINDEPLPIASNIGHAKEPNWFFSPEETLNSEQTLLPCEFCDELFPSDSLCQHQAICEVNSETTPKVMSPKVTNSYVKKKSHLKNGFEQSVMTSSNQQNSAALDSSDEEIDIGMQCNPSTKHENARQTWASPYDLRSTLQKYGVEGDRGNDLHLRPHGSSHYAQNSSDSEEDKKRVPARPAIRQATAERTHRTLNRLLQVNDNDVCNYANIPVANKGRSGNDTRMEGSSRQGATNHTKHQASNPSSKGAKPFKKRVSARDVQQELDNRGVQSSASAPQAHLHTRSRAVVNQNIPPGSKPRQCSRANSYDTDSHKTENKMPSRRNGDMS